MHDSSNQLMSSIQLLDTLQQSTSKQSFRFDLSWLVSLYSHQSQEKAQKAYQAALHHILLPEIKNYFAEYLTNPVNKNGDDVYAVLKAYLMMRDARLFNAAEMTYTLKKILPKSIQKNETDSLTLHLKTLLESPFTPMTLDDSKIQLTRKYLTGLPPLKLAYIILKNMNGNPLESDIQIEKENASPIFSNQELAAQIPVMFTAQMFQPILSELVNFAAREADVGNLVLGQNALFNPADIDATLADQLRIHYVSQYIETWENLLDNIHLSIPSDLEGTDAMIENIISTDSPLLHLLKIVYDNTNYEPILISSPKLEQINSLMHKTENSQKILYTLFAGMQSLHQYLQTILRADNIRQAAYDAVSHRMRSDRNPDAITQLRVIAESCHSPVRQWLMK